MKTNFFKFSLPVALAGIILANIYILQNSWLGCCLFFVILYYYGRKLGQKIFSKFDLFFQLLYGSLLFLASNSIILWIGFYLYRLNHFTIILSFLITTIAIELFTEKINKSAQLQASLIKEKFSTWFIGFLAFLLPSFVFLFKVRTDQAISSPWNLLTSQFFLYFIFTTFFLIIFLLKSHNSTLKKISLILYSCLFSCLALMIYKIGYGYDPFLHLAAMKNIIASGFLLPKTIYYVGEYSSLIFIQNITQVSIEFLNKIFLPLSWAIFFPSTIYYALTEGAKLKEKYALPAILGALILPINYFILTTPQGITNLLCLIIIFLSFTSVNRLFLLILGIYTFTIHPLFGFPILAFIIYLYIKELENKKIQKYLGAFIAFGSAFIFPLLFIANSFINGFKVSFKWPNLSEIVSSPIWQYKHQFRFIEDLNYAVGANLKLLFFASVIIGVCLLITRKEFKKFKVTFVFGLIMFANYFITKLFINFNFATNQNQAQFLQRIFELALYFWLPIFIYLIYILIQKNFQEKENLIGKVFVVLLLVLVTSTSLYFSYPVKDDYKDSKEYNVTKADIEAVQLINNHAAGSYIVLSNQMLAAAAIRENGFAHYYNNEFYYSIPNASKDSVYHYFEKMVFEEVKLEYIQKAGNSAGVQSVYFVLPIYWSNSEKIIEETKLIANDYFTTDNNTEYIFYFKIKP